MSNDNNNNRINTLYDQPEQVVRRITRNGGTISEWIVCGGTPERMLIVPTADLARYERENNVGCAWRISPVVPEGYDINGYRLNNKENNNA
jgi:hypothetical protein